MQAYLEGEQIKLLLNGHLDVFSKLNKNASQWKTRHPRPLLLGIPMNFPMMVYPSGGCGHVLNRAGLHLFAQRVLREFLPDATDPEKTSLSGHHSGNTELVLQIHEMNKEHFTLGVVLRNYFINFDMQIHS